MTRPVGAASSQLRTIETTGVMPQPAANAMQVPRPAAGEWGVKLPFGGSTSSEIAGPHMLRKVSREATLGMHPGDDPQQPLARCTDQRIRPSHLLARERGAQNDVLAGDAAVFHGELRRNFQSQRDSVFGLGLHLRYAQRVKSQHGVRCT